MQKTRPFRFIAGALLALALLFAFFAPQMETFYGEGAWTPLLIICGVIALAGFALLTVGVFLNKKLLMVIGAGTMLAVALASLVFSIIGLSTGGGSYRYYNYYSERYYWRSCFNDFFYGFSMISGLFLLAGWILTFFAVLKKTGGKVLAIIAGVQFSLALVFMFCACIETRWYDDATLFVVFRWIYLIMLFQAMIMLAIALPSMKQAAAAAMPAEYPAPMPEPVQPLASERYAPVGAAVSGAFRDMPAPPAAPEPPVPEYVAPEPPAAYVPPVVPAPPAPEIGQIEDAVRQIEEAAEAADETVEEVVEEAPELVEASVQAAEEQAAEAAAEAAGEVADQAEEIAGEVTDAADREDELRRIITETVEIPEENNKED